MSSLLTESQVSKLGLSIEPAEVRLITGPDDPYTWQTLPEKRHLFRKQLSKHSIGAYRELCRGVGVSFEAVTRTPSRSDASKQLEQERMDLPCSAGPEISFTSRIDQLRSENLRLIAERDAASSQAAKESELNETAVAENIRLREALQRVKTDEQMLRQHVQKLQGMLNLFRHTISRSVDNYLGGSQLDFRLPGSGRTERPKSQAG